MKNLKTRGVQILLFAVIMVFAASCSSEPKQLMAIPDDAVVVVAFDTKSILSKSELDKSDNPLNKMMKDLANDQNAPTTLVEILKNPKNAPISIMDDMFLFVSKTHTGFVAKVSDEDKLKKVFKELDIDDIIKKDKCSIVELDRSTVCAWDGDRFLFLSANDYDKRDELEDYAQTLLTQKKENSILANKGFSDFYGKKKDVSAWLCYDNVPREIKKEIRSEVNIDLSELEVGFFLTFEKGQTKLEANLIKASDEFKAHIKEYNCTDGKISGDLLKYLPEQSIVAFAASLNGEKLYDVFSKTNKRELSQVESEAKEANVDIKKLLSSFKGDVVFSLYDVINIPKKSYKYNYNTGDYEDVMVDSPMPVLTVLAEAKDDYALNSVVNFIKKEMGDSAVSKDGDVYMLDIDGVKAAFGKTDKYYFFTLDELAVSKIKSGYDKSLFDSELKKEMKNSFSYGYMNLNLDKYPASSRKAIDEFLADEFDLGVATILSKQLNSVQIYATSESSAELILKYADEKENSAKIIVQTIANILQKFM